MSSTIALESEAPTFDREALLSLLAMLDAQSYRFVTATPGTHARVLARPDRQEARELRDVLGWSLPFAARTTPAEVLDRLESAGAIEKRSDNKLAARLRVSSVRETLFLHSAYPTLAPDSVFLGPDSYRFADFIVAQMAPLAPGARILDYGAGAGVGGISAARERPGTILTLADINPKALFLASINAEFAGIEHQTVEATAPNEVPGDFDLIVTHPPFMMDDQNRAYRHGGDLYGARLSLDWVLSGARKLKPGGQLILHTGVSIVEGRDVLLDELTRASQRADWRLDYRELDPDIFSEDLDQPAYAEVERIAAVGLVVTRNAAQAQR